jgi:hypothetical protein
LLALPAEAEPAAPVQEESSYVAHLREETAKFGQRMEVSGTTVTVYRGDKEIGSVDTASIKSGSDFTALQFTGKLVKEALDFMGLEDPSARNPGQIAADQAEIEAKAEKKDKAFTDRSRLRGDMDRKAAEVEGFAPNFAAALRHGAGRLMDKSGINGMAPGPARAVLAEADRYAEEERSGKRTNWSRLWPLPHVPKGNHDKPTPAPAATSEKPAEAPDNSARPAALIELRKRASVLAQLRKCVAG